MSAQAAYWPVVIESAAERAEVLIGAVASRMETARRLIEDFVLAGYSPVVLVLESDRAPSFAEVAQGYPGRQLLLLAIGPEAVEAPRGATGRVVPLEEVIR